jgi:iron complex transport system substrate-binding protein
VRFRSDKQKGVAAAVAAMVFLGAGSSIRSQPDAVPRPFHRVVSMNLCVDEIVLRLGDRRKIASVTWQALNPESSNVSELASGIPVNYGMAEEIIPLNPDLVIAGIYTTRDTVAALKRIGVPTMDVDVPRSFADVRAQFLDLSRVLDEKEKGDRIVADIDDRLTQISARVSDARPRAFVFYPNGYTATKGTIVDEIVTRAGFVNAATSLGVHEYEQMPLETMIANPVDMLIMSSSRDWPPALATELLRHPVLARIAERTRIVVMPYRLWSCGGPQLVDAVERLVQERAAILRK